jgi:hypothetical protein
MNYTALGFAVNRLDLSNDAKSEVATTVSPEEEHKLHFENVVFCIGPDNEQISINHVTF